jgi:hypothetical protein
MSEAEVDYVIAAVHLAARYAGRLLPAYRFDPYSGLWRHRDAPPPPVSLAQVSYDGEGGLRHPVARPVELPGLPVQLRSARAVLAAGAGAGPATPRRISPELEQLRWFDTGS